MRTYGRLPPDDAGYRRWVEISTQEETGSSDYVWVTTICQCLLLILGESPFYAQHGIPSEQAIIQQVFPDFYVFQTQRQFAAQFSSLIITKIPDTRNPTYRVNIVTNFGTRFEVEIAI